MELEKILKQFKNIEADHDYVHRSRGIVLSSKLGIPKKRSVLFNIIFEGFELGSAIALTGILIVLTVGGFSIWRFISPGEISGLDIAGIRAEAQAVDIQIQLANLSYNDLTPATAESTQQTASSKKTTGRKQSNLGTNSVTGDNDNTSQEKDSDRNPTLEEVLETLSQ
jgi:hypothetical protein